MKWIRLIVKSNCRIGVVYFIFPAGSLFISVPMDLVSQQSGSLPCASRNYALRVGNLKADIEKGSMASQICRNIIHETPSIRDPENTPA